VLPMSSSTLSLTLAIVSISCRLLSRWLDVSE